MVLVRVRASGASDCVQPGAVHGVLSKQVGAAWARQCMVFCQSRWGQHGHDSAWWFVKAGEGSMGTTVHGVLSKQVGAAWELNE